MDEPRKWPQWKSASVAWVLLLVNPTLDPFQGQRYGQVNQATGSPQDRRDRHEVGNSTSENPVNFCASGESHVGAGPPVAVPGPAP